MTDGIGHQITNTESPIFSPSTYLLYHSSSILSTRAHVMSLLSQLRGAFFITFDQRGLGEGEGARKGRAHIGKGFSLISPFHYNERAETAEATEWRPNDGHKQRVQTIGLGGLVMVETIRFLALFIHDRGDMMASLLAGGTFFALPFSLFVLAADDGMNKLCLSSFSLAMECISIWLSSSPLIPRKHFMIPCNYHMIPIYSQILSRLRFVAQQSPNFEVFEKLLKKKRKLLTSPCKILTTPCYLSIMSH